MIRALFHSRPDNGGDCFICGFCEGTTVTNIRMGDDDGNTEQLKHVFSEEYCSGLITGGAKSRSICLVHLSCQGKICSCEKWAARYLEQVESGLGNLENYCKTTAREITVLYPFLAILVNGGEKVCIKVFSDEEYDVISLVKNSFEIRDCFLCEIDDSKFPNFIERPDIIRSVDIYDEAQRIVDSLASTYNLWPKISGLGLSFYSIEEKITFLINNPTDLEDLESIVDVARPKGPITAFNFYSKCARKSVVDDLDEKNLSNNDLNKVLGQKWKEMSHRDRNPYHIQAAQDRKRYLEEISIFNSHKRDRVSCSQMGIGKPLTAYNHFVHQEKLFVMGMDLPDAQTRMGKHGGDRWNDMDKGEKALYLILREANASDYC